VLVLLGFCALGPALCKSQCHAPFPSSGAQKSQRPSIWNANAQQQQQQQQQQRHGGNIDGIGSYGNDLSGLQRQLVGRVKGSGDPRVQCSINTPPEPATG